MVATRSVSLNAGNPGTVRYRRRTMGTTRLVVLIVVVTLASACANVAPGPATTRVDPESAPVPTEPSDSPLQPVLSDLPEPPGLVVHRGSSVATVPGFDYCWTLSDGTNGTCADSFGTEVPTPIRVDTPTVTLEWIEDGELSAWVRADDESCGARLSLESTGPGGWSLAMPPQAGTYRIDLSGKAPQGSTGFALLVTVSVDGPPAFPVATVWWPDTADGFEMSVELAGVDPSDEAVLAVVSADQVTTRLSLELRPSGSRCGPSEAEAVVAGVGALGAAPYQVSLDLTDATGRYELTWEWPRDMGSDDRLTRTMRSVVEPASAGASLVGAGWSFGMCGGICIADLTIETSQATLTESSRESDEPRFVNRGALTHLARTRIDSAADRLDGVVLEPVYGCPDCADGGAAYLVLERHGATARHSMNFGGPPEELAELYELAFTIIAALETCQSNELVVVSESCEPRGS